MTVPTQTRPLAAASVPAAITTLRVRGLRVSSARRIVIEALFAADGPVTAEAIAAGLDGRLPTSDLGSVYRNLLTLEEVGLVRHFHVAHGPGLYALNGRDQAGYVACERCGAHRPLDRATVAHLAAVLRDACGYEPQFVHFPVIGHCQDCRHAHS